MKLTGVPISLDEFQCYKILHAVLRDNKVELICTLRDLTDVQARTGIAGRMLKSSFSTVSFRFISLPSYFCVVACCVVFAHPVPFCFTTYLLF